MGLIQNLVVNESDLTMNGLARANKNLTREVGVCESSHVNSLAIVALAIPSTESDAYLLVSLLEVVIVEIHHIMRLIRDAVGLNCFIFTLQRYNNSLKRARKTKEKCNI